VFGISKMLFNQVDTIMKELLGFEDL
jgi:hypothetical protein